MRTSLIEIPIVKYHQTHFPALNWYEGYEIEKLTYYKAYDQVFHLSEPCTLFALRSSEIDLASLISTESFGCCGQLVALE